MQSKPGNLNTGRIMQGRDIINHDKEQDWSQDSPLWDLFIDINKRSWESIYHNSLLSITEKADYPVNNIWINTIRLQFVTYYCISGKTESKAFLKSKE